MAPAKASPTAGSMPPTTLVPPPKGMTAAFAASAHSRIATTSSSLRGDATASGALAKSLSKARTESRNDLP